MGAQSFVQAILDKSVMFFYSLCRLRSVRVTSSKPRSEKHRCSQIRISETETANTKSLLPNVFFFFVNILCLNKPPIYQNPERFLHTALFCSFSAPATVKSALHKEGTAVIWRFIGFFPGEIGAILCLSL